MRASHVLPAGTWEAAAVDHVVLDFDGRHRRRAMLRTESGQEVLLDLLAATRLRDGDGLCLDEGGVIRVVARPEPVMDISGADAAALVRIAWHLGNRHLPVQLLDSGLRIRADHVIAEMVAGLGGTVEAREAPFDPEPGAYASAHRDHYHDDDH
ncbi:MAG: urease accessory protein UreE [Acetobacteraceae bacterium]|nr:urease accessory protein UreE [Acetobacteraceae bacterium]